MTAVGDDPNVQRRQLRVVLRQQREAAKLTQRAVADALDWSLSKLIRIEAGAQRVSVTDLRAMLTLYAVTDKDVVEGLVSAARSSRLPTWWHAYQDVVSPQFAQYLGHEGVASSFRIFHPFAVPGLLQTGEYATELVSAFGHRERARRVSEFRLKRQERLLGNSQLEFEFILNEESLYRLVGGADAMQRQLQHLLDVGEQPNVSIRILPFSAGANPGLGGPLVLLYSDVTKESMVFLEGTSDDRLVKEDPEDVATYEIYFEQMSDLSLAPDQGRDLLLELIRQMKARHS